MNKVYQFIKARGVWECLIAISVFSLFLGHLSFLSRIYQPILLVCLACLCTKLKNAKIGWAEVLLILACSISIVLGNPLPIFNSWMRLGLFLIVLFIATPLITSPSINLFRLRLFNWVCLICVFTGVGSFFAYFLGVNCMRSYHGDVLVTLGGTFGGLTVHSMLLGPLAALGMLRCVYIAIRRYKQGEKASWFLYGSAFACFISVLMASSRGAAGAALVAVCYLIYEKLRHKMGKLIKIALCLSCLAVPLTPVFEYFSSGLVAKQKSNMTSGGTFNSRDALWNARLEEFKDAPLCGVGFSAQRYHISKFTRLTGVIEPGSSYGAVFAMTGLLGGSIFLYILGRAFIKKKRHQMSLPQIYLVFFSIHLFVEGYVFAGGNALCFIFWLCIGAASAIKHNQRLNQLVV